MRAVRGFRVACRGGKRRRTRAIRLPPVVSENFPGLGEMVPGKFSERIACPCAPCGFRAPMRVQGRRQKGPQQEREAVSRAREAPAIRQLPHPRGREHRRVGARTSGVGRRGARRGYTLPDSAGFRGREGRLPCYPKATVPRGRWRQLQGRLARKTSRSSHDVITPRSHGGSALETPCLLWQQENARSQARFSATRTGTAGTGQEVIGTDWGCYRNLSELDEAFFETDLCVAEVGGTLAEAGPSWRNFGGSWRKLAEVEHWPRLSGL